MRSTVAGLLLCLLLLPISAQSQTTRFLIVGDSWAEEQWLDGSHARVFGTRGLQTIGTSGELTTTSGSTAADWVSPANLSRIDDALAQYPHLDTVQLTIGGNDFLGSWNIGFDQSQFDALIASIVQDIQIITDYILIQRPELEIIISLYDYPNFEDTRNGLIWVFACNSLWNDLGQPSPQQVNTAAVQVIDAVEGFADGNPRIQHVRHLGEAQQFFGSTMLPPPGDITQPSPPQAMRERFAGGGRDCFHFNATAYDVLVDNLVDGYLDQRFAAGLQLSLDTAAVEYNGSPRSAMVTTLPADQALIVTYDGELQAPTAVGSYSLTVTAPGWRESLSATFDIIPGSQSIAFSAPATLPPSAPPLAIQANASSGLPVTIDLISGPATLVDGVLTLDGVVGQVELRATQAGDDNWQPAQVETRIIEIVPLGDLLFQDRFQTSP
ncbi:MAG: MBG domain-containing protein [Pseudomonadota bacterium]